MANAEQAIRAAMDTFIKASETGDLEAAKSVIAEDAVFFVPHAGTILSAPEIRLESK
jgi:ketosteroid isomerase-like protein